MVSTPGSDSIIFVIAVSLLGLAGIISQPHVVTANGAGKTEREAQIGMCYGNFIKRFLTIAWTLTGMIAFVVFADSFTHLEPGSEEYIQQSETLFGRAVQALLGDGWRGLMIACIIAGSPSKYSSISAKWSMLRTLRLLDSCIRL